jgi:hypothetical protein
MLRRPVAFGRATLLQGLAYERKLRFKGLPSRTCLKEGFGLNPVPTNVSAAEHEKLLDDRI